MKWRESVRALVFCGLPFVPFFFLAPSPTGLPGAFAVAYAGVVAPGIAGLCFRGMGTPFHNALTFLGSASILTGAALVLRWALGTSTQAGPFAAILGGLTVAVAVAGTLRGRNFPRPHVPTALLGLLAFALSLFAGMRIVPPLEDQDMEVQGTAYGIVHELQPICLTNRGTLYFFAHPPLLHLLNAGTLLLAGELNLVKAPYDAAKAEAGDSRDHGPVADRIAKALGGGVPRPDRTLAWMRDVYAAFLNYPALLGTRAPNFVLAAALCMLLFAALRRLAVSVGDAALLCVAQITLPEIFVRSGYGGYYAVSAFTFLLATWVAAEGGARSCFASGALALLANHKSVLLGATSLVLGIRRALPFVVGLAVAWCAFAAFGLVVAPEEFVADHLLDHGLLRFSGQEVVGRAGVPAYPSRSGLWLQFAGHFGWLWCTLVAAAVASVGAGWARGKAPSPFVRMALAWILVGAALFTWTDWRQTKHLCKLVPAMTLLLGAWLASASPRWRVTLRVALVVCVAWNLTWMVKIAQDFESLAVTPLW